MQSFSFGPGMLFNILNEFDQLIRGNTRFGMDMFGMFVWGQIISKLSMRGEWFNERTVPSMPSM